MTGSERQTIEALRHGDHGTFRMIFDDHYEGLCQYAFTILKDMDEAEDIVQSMFIKIWEQRMSIEIKQAIRPYLFKSVYHKCMNFIEHSVVKQKYQDYGLHLTKNDVQHPEVFYQEMEENVRDAINKLPPQCRLIFILSRYEELRYSKIAERLDISINTVENQISKALKILRTELKDIFV